MGKLQHLWKIKMMFNRNLLISTITLLFVNGISYFLILPFAHSRADAHYYNLELSIFYVILTIAVPIMLYKFCKGFKHKLFNIILLTISLSLIGWVIYLNSIECSLCSTGG